MEGLMLKNAKDILEMLTVGVGPGAGLPANEDDELGKNSVRVQCYMS